MGLKDTSGTKDLLILLCGLDCILPYLDAIKIARKAVFAIEDGSISLNAIFRGRKDYSALRTAAVRYYSQVLEKHPNAKTIVLTSDDFTRVSLAKKATQEKRNTGEGKKPFSLEELASLSENVYVSRMHKSTEGNKTLTSLYNDAKTEFLESRQPSTKKSRTMDPTVRVLSRSSSSRPAKRGGLPAVYDNAFKWYMTRLLATRPYKPDAAFHFYWLLIKEHHDKNIVYRQDEQPYMPEGQQLLIDGIPWTERMQQAAEHGRGKGIKSWARDVSTPSEYTRGPIDGGGGGNAQSINPNFLSRYYVPEENDGARTAMIAASSTGLHLLPDEWRTVLGEADHKIVDWIRRMVARIRSDQFTPPAAGQLPVIFVTTLDTDAFPMILALLEELYSADPGNIDFLLYVDMTPTNNFPLLYNDICDHPDTPLLDYVEMRDAQHRKLFEGLRGDDALGCSQVFDYTTIWSRLRASLAEMMPGARYPLYSFITLLGVCGTDYVPEFVEHKPKDFHKAFFMGGHLLLDRAIHLERIDQGGEGVRLLVHMNETYLNDFVRLVLTFGARAVSSPDIWSPRDAKKSALSMYSTTEFRHAEKDFNTCQVSSPKIIASIRALQRKDVYDGIKDLKKVQVAHRRKLNAIVGEADRSTVIRQQNAEIEARCSRIMRATNKLAGAVRVDCGKMRTEFMNAAQGFSRRCVSDESGTPMYGFGHRMMRRYILDMEDLETRYKRLRRQKVESNRGGGRGPRKRSGSNGLFVNAPSPSPQQRENPTPFEEWAKRPVSRDSVDVFVRMVHHNLWLWTSGTHKGWHCLTELADPCGASYTGYSVLKRRGGKRVLFAKAVGSLST